MEFNFSLFARKQKTLAALKDDKTSTTDKKGKKLTWKSRSVSEAKYNVQLWKQAETMALSETPRNYALQLIIEDAKKDALLTSQIENRKNQVFSSDIRLLKPNGEKDEEQSAILKRLPLYRFLTHQKLDALYAGYSHVELSYKTLVNGKTILIGDKIPRTNMVPQSGLFYPDYSDDQGLIKYRELPEFGIWILEYLADGLGLINKAVPHVLFKRFAQSCWVELCQIYGIPPRWMKTNTQDQNMLDRAEQMMKDMGSAAWYVIDDTEEFGFAQGTSTNGDVYNSLISLCSNEMCLLICGAIIAQDTKNGSRSKDESAQEILWLLVQSDMAMLEEQWNSISLPALQKHGIIKGDVTFEFEPSEDTPALFKMVTELLPHFEIDPEWIKEKFGIEVTGIKKLDKENATKEETLAAFKQLFNALKAKTKTDLELADFFE